MKHTVTGAIKEWRKYNEVIGQVKINYKKILQECREFSLVGDKYRECQELCAKYQYARSTAVTKGLVPFEDKSFRAHLNKWLSKQRKLDITHGSLSLIEKTFHLDVLPQLYNVANFGCAMFSIPLKNGDNLDVKLLASPFQEEGELMLQLFLDDRCVYNVCSSCTDDGRAYIGDTQGGKDITNDEVKVLAKELRGTRPKNIIMSVLYGFLRYFSIITFYAIDSDFHVKSDLAKASYSSLWLEMGGEKQTRGWYKLPAQEIKKSIEEVKSKHRSQSIKRKGVKESIQINTANALQHITLQARVN